MTGVVSLYHVGVNFDSKSNSARKGFIDRYTNARLSMTFCISFLFVFCPICKSKAHVFVLDCLNMCHLEVIAYHSWHLMSHQSLAPTQFDNAWAMINIRGAHLLPGSLSEGIPEPQARRAWVSFWFPLKNDDLSRVLYQKDTRALHFRWLVVAARKHP